MGVGRGKIVIYQHILKEIIFSKNETNTNKLKNKIIGGYHSFAVYLRNSYPSKKILEYMAL